MTHPSKIPTAAGPHYPQVFQQCFLGLAGEPQGLKVHSVNFLDQVRLEVEVDVSPDGSPIFRFNETFWDRIDKSSTYFYHWMRIINPFIWNCHAYKVSELEMKAIAKYSPPSVTYVTIQCCQ